MIMSSAMWSGNSSRKIVERIVVEGELVLETPTHFGNGDGDDITDMPLLVDAFDGKTPLLTGASITGALRSYLRSREYGYKHPKPQNKAAAKKENEESNASLLFGGLSGYDEGEQSPLVVDDAYGINPGIEMRNGVKLNSSSRTAENDALFDMQFWQAGTRFPLRFELALRVSDSDKATKMKRALASVLEGFKDGGITLGARKRRGYGRVRVDAWRVKIYSLKTANGLANGLIDWIENGGKPLSVAPTNDINKALGTGGLIDDARRVFQIKATFALDGSLLIRSSGGRDDKGPDMVYLSAHQANGSIQPILSGTSLAGALRARATKIAKSLDRLGNRHDGLINGMFGAEMKKKDNGRVGNNVKPEASRVIVREDIVKNSVTNLVQNRVSIDRFTAGARDTALFNEQPIFGGEVIVNVQLENPKKEEIGLLLLLLKDLWTGDLALGGESSIGRGRLKGKKAELIYKTPDTQDGSFLWSLEASANALSIPDEAGEKLESYVTAFKTHLRGTNE
jgi:CRISPR/Cas system CSM-associated protein Csm3 (group 7 of RAMP superfamily)